MEEMNRAKVAGAVETGESLDGAEMSGLELREMKFHGSSLVGILVTLI